MCAVAFGVEFDGAFEIGQRLVVSRDTRQRLGSCQELRRGLRHRLQLRHDPHPPHRLAGRARQRVQRQRGLVMAAGLVEQALVLAPPAEFEHLLAGLLPRHLKHGPVYLFGVRRALPHGRVVRAQQRRALRRHQAHHDEVLRRRQLENHVTQRRRRLEVKVEFGTAPHLDRRLAAQRVGLRPHEGTRIYRRGMPEQHDVTRRVEFGLADLVQRVFERPAELREVFLHPIAQRLGLGRAVERVKKHPHHRQALAQRHLAAGRLAHADRLRRRRARRKPRHERRYQRRRNEYLCL